ncbi:hypothetical protein A6I89_12250 [Prescottella equi]|uniref:Uncharacterized protein n=1 Tax=Rhodococcus hoagii TaxID=43767 RepID=A0AAE5ITW4_RHOHA|nr:hypothetical protein A4U94_11730 [Prescottella equi]ORJ99178.1 hypothetical protein A6F56_11615 [Prescottella equi]ORL08176.1 hypothetical protein A6I84_10760 [Prescottella equi]ORL26814.1 hypothetical protein A6I89_12250 [Prescottella equi]ORL36835.1 hypothetical protein A6I87_10165 [Prescottella equi]
MTPNARTGQGARRHRRNAPGQRPNSDAKKPDLAGFSHVQRSLAGTVRMTLSTCWPQPPHVVLEQVLQVTG